MLDTWTVEHVKTDFDTFENVQRCQLPDSGQGSVVEVEDAICATQSDLGFGLALQLVARPREVELDRKLGNTHSFLVAVNVHALGLEGDGEH